MKIQPFFLDQFIADKIPSHQLIKIIGMGDPRPPKKPILTDTVSSEDNGDGKPKDDDIVLDIIKLD